MQSPDEQAAAARAESDAREARIAELSRVLKGAPDGTELTDDQQDASINAKLSAQSEIDTLKRESLQFMGREREALSRGAQLERDAQRAQNEQARLEAEAMDARFRAEEQQRRTEERRQDAARKYQDIAREVAKVDAEPDKKRSYWSDSAGKNFARSIGLVFLIAAASRSKDGGAQAMGIIDDIANREVEDQQRKRKQAADRLGRAQSVYDLAERSFGSEEAAIAATKAATLTRISEQLGRAAKTTNDVQAQQNIAAMRAEIQGQILAQQETILASHARVVKETSDERTMTIKHSQGGYSPGESLQDTARGFIKDGFSPEQAYAMAQEAHATGAATINQAGTDLKPEDIGRVLLPDGSKAWASKDAAKELEERAASIAAVEDVIGEIITLANKPGASTDPKIREQIKQKGNEAGTRVGVAFGQGAQGLEEAKKFAALAAAGANDILSVGNRGQIDAARAMVGRMKKEVYGRFYSDPSARTPLLGGSPKGVPSSFEAAR